jgi:hypothetical protein
MKKIVLGILLFLIAAYIIFDKIGDAGLSKEFLAEVDSLHKVNDSLFVEIKKDDAAIDSLNYVSEELTYKIEHQKAKIIKVVQYVDSSKNAIDSYTEHQLVSSFNSRYPKDTVTNKLPLAQPVLISVAKDLVELDGAKQIIVLKDSSIHTLEAKVTVKDSVISKYISKEDKFRLILTNKDKEIDGWEGQYQKLELQYNKLKVKSKFQRIGSYVVIGGLGYLMLAK